MINLSNFWQKSVKTAQMNFLLLLLRLNIIKCYIKTLNVKNNNVMGSDF